MRIAHTHAGVVVPATSANLGPGYDTLGMALSLHDRLEVEATAGGLEIEVTGEGQEDLSRGEDHLVVQALRAGLDHVGAPQAGLRLRAANAIPHGRGLGSSAAAVIAGLLLARGLIADPEALPDEEVLALAAEIEGHPDNAAPALLGGATVSWTRADGTVRAVRWDDPEQTARLRPVVLLPTATLSTSSARRLLPAEVPHEDAAFTASRCALLVHALTRDPSLLMDATEDRLHQGYRRDGMPQSVELMRVLRHEGYPAVISGAGPSVLVLDDAAGANRLPGIVREAVDDPRAWRLARVGIDRSGARSVLA